MPAMRYIAKSGVEARVIVALERTLYVGNGPQDTCVVEFANGDKASLPAGQFSAAIPMTGDYCIFGPDGALLVMARETFERLYEYEPCPREILFRRCGEQVAVVFTHKRNKNDVLRMCLACADAINDTSEYNREDLLV